MEGARGGITAFIVPRDAPGMSVASLQNAQRAWLRYRPDAQPALAMSSR